MTSRTAGQCYFCRHWISPLDRGDAEARAAEPTQICKAFPNGIPEEIWWNRADHRNPFAGDGGIQWAPDGEGVEFPSEAMIAG